MNFRSYFTALLETGEKGDAELIARFVASYTGGQLYSHHTMPTTEHLEKRAIPAAVEKDMEGLMYLIALSPRWMAKVYRKFTYHPNLDAATRDRILQKWLSACTIMPYLPPDFPNKGAYYARKNTLQNTLPTGTHLHIVTKEEGGVDGYLAGFTGNKVVLSRVPLHYQYMWLDIDTLQEVPTEIIQVISDAEKRSVTYVGRTNYERAKISNYLATMGSKAQVSTGLSAQQIRIGEALLFWYNKDVLLNIRVEDVLQLVEPHPNFMIFVKDSPPHNRLQSISPESKTLGQYRFFFIRS